MKQKLTLTVERDAVASIKRIAASQRTSVSALFEQWSRNMARSGAGSGLGESLRGRWKTAEADGDPRFDYLRSKHVRG